MLINRRDLSHFIFCFLFLLEACAPTLPVTKNKALPMPPSFPQVTSVEDKSLSLPEVSWSKFFQDPKLGTLINEALKNNQELNILKQDIAIANNEILSRSGEYLPRVGVKADSGVRRTQTFTEALGEDPLHFSNAGVTASWEIDIWNKLRNATKAAYFEYLATVEAQRLMVTRIVAEISSTYFELLALDNQLEIVDNYVKILEQVRDMVTLQLKAGRTTSLAVKRFEAEVLKNKARQYKLQQEIIVTENKINVLLGRYPQKVDRSSKDFATYLLAPLKSAVPSRLLNNRPDIRRAMMELEANKLNVEVAKARFYPSLSIEGEAGYEKFNAKHFQGPVSAFYGIAAGITAPLLNRRAIKADYFTANNKQIQAIYHFEKTMIKAYTDVANQLSRIKNLNKMVDLKSKQVNALNQSFEISNVLFRAARVDYIETLMTQRDALEAQLELVKIKKDQLSTSVSLYRSLGGGWREDKEKVESNHYD